MFYCKNLLRSRCFFISNFTLIDWGPYDFFCCIDWFKRNFSSSICYYCIFSNFSILSSSSGNCMTSLTVDLFPASLFRSMLKIYSNTGCHPLRWFCIGVPHENRLRLSNGYFTIFCTTSGIFLPEKGCLREHSSYKTHPSIQASLL